MVSASHDDRRSAHSPRRASDIAGSLGIQTHRIDLTQILSLSEYLLTGQSLNEFNRSVFELLRDRSRHLEKQLSTPPALSEEPAILELRRWFLFAVTTQNYRSPSAKQENTVFHGGIVQIDDGIRYLRSESNTPIFGEAYDRHIVLIREAAARSFMQLAASYIFPDKARKILSCPWPDISLAEFLGQDGNREGMLVIETGTESAPELFEQIRAVLSRYGETLDRGFYLRFSEVLPPIQRTAWRELIVGCGSNAQILLDEPYDPLSTGSSGFWRVTFVHNQKSAFRYQLLQDGASMGYRPSLEQVVEYYFKAGQLARLLNTTSRTMVLTCNRTTAVETSGPDSQERCDDLAVLQATVKICNRDLEALGTRSVLEQQILHLARREGLDIQSLLEEIATAPQSTVKQTVETFHSAHSRLRTLIQYLAHLEVTSGVFERAKLEHQLAAHDGGSHLAVNSGIAAARMVIMTLGEKVEAVFSTDHYWENDFLIENLFSHNPHYPEIRGKLASRLEKVSHYLTLQDIEELVTRILAQNPGCSGGQMLCFDRAISPFFFTRTFDLHGFTQALSRRAKDIRNPIYLVVDPTLDFDQVTAGSLFPQGLPPKVFLILTPSHAKLHQLGMDIVTGGMISLYSHPQDRSALHALRDELEQRLEAEDGQQTDFQLAVLNQTYFQHRNSGTLPLYLGYMLTKRQRNTRAFIEQAIATLAKDFVEAGSGIFNYRSPATGKNELRIPDQEGAVHTAEVSLHYEPQAPIHAYFKFLEPAGSKYLAAAVFEEIKRRVFVLAAAEGIQLADGTSWGFTITRFGHYMHTLRIAVGVEHASNLAILGAIFGATVNELVDYPQDFLKPVAVLPMTSLLLNKHADEIAALDGLVPGAADRDSNSQRSAQSQYQDGIYSFVISDHGRLTSMVRAYPEQKDGVRFVFISKAATLPENRAKGQFRRILNHILARAAADGIQTIRLETSLSRKNESVVRAYEKCGFGVTRARARMLPNGWPLVLGTMERGISDAGKQAHYRPVPDEIYEQCHKNASLEPLKTYLAATGLPLE